MKAKRAKPKRVDRRHVKPVRKGAWVPPPYTSFQGKKYELAGKMTKRALTRLGRLTWRQRAAVGKHILFGFSRMPLTVLETFQDRDIDTMAKESLEAYKAWRQEYDHKEYARETRRLARER